MSDISDRELVEWRMLTNEATLGPWRTVQKPEYFAATTFIESDAPNVYPRTIAMVIGLSHPGSEFLALTREMVPVLLDEVIAVRAENKALREGAKEAEVEAVRKLALLRGEWASVEDWARRSSLKSHGPWARINEILAE